MDNDRFISFEEVRRAGGYDRRLLRERIKEAGLTIYADGRDRRRRLLDRRELPRLTEPRVVEQGHPQAEQPSD